ncbi:MAG: dicarboxylate/amino acid:cation symporter [Bdellovibrionales bacterium]|nr:dicarboxylate/amino acid:cation symporter [Bdellovibrionales bacterium]
MKPQFLLTVAILIGLVLGTVVGQLLFDPTWRPELGESAHAAASWLRLFDFLGQTVFMGLLTMLIVPLVFTSVVVAVTSVGDFRALGRIGGMAMLYYVSTMVVAVTIGLAVVTLLQPGAAMTGAAPGAVAETTDAGSQLQTSAAVAAGGVLGVFDNLIRLLIPTNIVQAFAEGQTLGVIFFALFFGVVLASRGEQAKPIVQLFEVGFEVLLKMVEIVLFLAPVGVFALLAWTVARVGLGVFADAIGQYMVAVVVGLLLHGMVVLPLLLLIFARTSPFHFAHCMRAALMTAFATDSSSATLPVTLDCATGEGGIKRRVAGLVLPLGATVNMDGTALYEAVAVVFLAQVFGVDLSAIQLVLIAVTATLAAIGAAGIPSAGLVTMVIVVQAVNESVLAGDPAGQAIPLTGIGLLIGVDRMLDMLRTTVNVWGDAVGAKIIDRWTPEDF